MPRDTPLWRRRRATALAPSRFDPATLVVIAAPRELGREWRLVVVGDRVIAASRYAEGGSRSVEAGCPHVVRDFAAAILAEVRWRPDPIFMIDVAESDGRLWLVELNGFSCFWLYQCDLAEVVATASELAVREWSASHPRPVETAPAGEAAGGASRPRGEPPAGPVAGTADEANPTGQ
jgi:hypothetical protein